MTCRLVRRAEPPIEIPDIASLAAARDPGALWQVVPGSFSPQRQPSSGLGAEIAWWRERLGLGDASRVPRLRPKLRRALATVLAAARAADALRSEAVPADPGFGRAARRALVRYGSSSIAERRVPPALVRIGRRIDVHALERALGTLVAGAERATGALKRPDGTACEGALQEPTEVAGLIAVDPAGVRTRYDKPYLVTLDLGGCDSYVGEQGAARGPEDPIGITIDLGDSPDSYAAGEKTFAFGAASEGLALLLDAGGDDVYAAQGYAAQGAGIVGGAGALIDLGGNDRYELAGRVGGYGAQGIGTLGFGALMDAAGDDVYSYEVDPGEATFGSRLLGAQGAGIVGQAVLVDAAGDDRYFARTVGNIVSLQGQGTGDFLLGNYGLLIDGSGDDDYLMEAEVSSADRVGSGGVAGQGVGIFDAAGLLLDGSGDDVYSLSAVAVGATGAVAESFGQGAASGSLRDPAWGGLIDASGDDVYSAEAGARADAGSPTATGALVQGFGLLEGIGVSVDGSGDDVRTATATGEAALAGGQGAGLAAGAGLLVDHAGNDSYSSGELSQGYGGGFDFGDLDVPGGSGALLDGGGRDSFSGPGRTAMFWTQGDDGIGVGLTGRLARLPIDLFDSFFPDVRPRPGVEVAIVSPKPGTAVHGDLPIGGTASDAPLPPDAVEWTIGDVWRLASKDGTWRSWSALVDVDVMEDGPHTLSARAWSNGLDSAPAEVSIQVDRWIPLWHLEAAGDGVAVVFDLARRNGEPVEEDGIAVEVRQPSGVLVTTLQNLDRAGNRYSTTWSPSEGGTYIVSATFEGQVLGETSVQV